MSRLTRGKPPRRGLSRTCAVILGISGFARILLAQAPIEPAVIDQHATLVGYRIGVDSIAFRLEQDTAAILRLVLDRLHPVALVQLRAGQENEPLSVGLAVENRSTVPLRIPMWVFVDHTVEVIRRGRSMSPWYGPRDAGVADPPHVWGQTTPTTVDVAVPQFSNSIRLHRLEMPGAEIATLAPGQRSPTVSLGIGVAPEFEEFRIRLVLRALPTAPPVPATAPPELPRSVLATARVVRADHAPLPFAAGLITLRFQPTASPAIRQMFVERLGGHVVGGMGEAGMGGERDYVVALADSTSADWTVRAVGLARRWREPFLLRAGLIFTERPPQPPVLSPLPTMDEFDQRTPVLTVTFARDATAEEIASAFASVGATPIGIDPKWGTYVAHLADGADSAYRKAESRLETLAAIRIVGAWTRAMNSIQVCAGWCGPPPQSSGQAPGDPAIRAFIDSLGLPDVHAIRDVVSLPAFDVLAFSVIYGRPGDVYPSVQALRHRGRIGILHPNSWQTTRVPGDFPFTAEDTSLIATSLLDTLEQQHATYFAYVYLRAMLLSPLVDRAVMRRVVVRCYAHEVGCYVPDVVEAAVRIRDIATLTELSFLAADQAYNTNKAVLPRQALRRLAPEILADSAASSATLFMLALSLLDEPDSLLTVRMLAHPVARHDLAVLTLLVEHHRWMADSVLARLPTAARPIIASVLGKGPGSVSTTDIDRVYSLLADPVLGRDRSVLTVLANHGRVLPSLIRAEAARRLPETVYRRWDFYPAPPLLDR